MNEPYYAIVNDASGSTSCFFAIQLVEIGTRLGIEANQADFITNQLRRQIDLISTLPSLGVDSAIELRITSDPLPARTRAGSISVFLRVRAQAANAELAHQAGRAAYRSLWTNLVSLFDGYKWNNVLSSEAYDAAIRLPEDVAFVDLYRRESLVVPWQKGDAESNPVGFSTSTTDKSANSTAALTIYHPSPFVSTLSSLEILFEALLQSPTWCAVSVRLRPTRATRAEEAFVQSQIEQAERFLTLPSTSGPVWEPSEYSPPLTAETQLARGELVRLSHMLRDDCFRVQTTVIAAGSVPWGFIHALGVSVTQPVSGISGAAEADSARQIYSGGFDHQHHVGAERIHSQRANIYALELDPAPAGLLPPHIGRLRELMDARQANTVFRLPLPLDREFPGLDTRFSRSLPLPNECNEDGVLIGINEYRSGRLYVGLSLDDRRRHAYVVGQTGTGKSNLLLNMILQDIEAGHGLCLVDPHGELSAAVLASIPKSRLNDVIYFCPDSPETSVGLNLVDYVDAVDRERAINGFLEIFDELYDLKQVGGPVFEYNLRMAFRLVMTDPSRKAALPDIPRVFMDAKFREKLLEKVTDDDVLYFWKVMFPGMTGDWKKENMSAYILSKFTRLLDNSLMKPIVEERDVDLRFRTVMDEKKVFIANLAKGKLGSTNCAFLGMILLDLIGRAAFSRENVSESERPDFFLYVDEFQNLATENLIELLSEARKYRLNLILANQYLEQIPDKIRHAVMGNVGTIMSFRLGMNDAAIIENHFAPTVTKHDLANLPNFTAYVKTLVSGEAVKPFDIRTLPYAGVTSQETVAKIIANTSQNYGLIPVRERPVFRVISGLDSETLAKLRHAKIATIADLMSQRENDLLTIVKIAGHEIREMRSALEVHGLAFGLAL